MQGVWGSGKGKKKKLGLLPVTLINHNLHKYKKGIKKIPFELQYKDSFHPSRTEAE